LRNPRSSEVSFYQFVTSRMWPRTRLRSRSWPQSLSRGWFAAN